MKNLLKSIGEILFKRLEKLLIYFNKKKYYSTLNIVTLTNNKKKYHFNINHLNFEKSEIREIKTKIFEYYFRNLKLNNSFKQHLFNHLIVINTDMSKKASLIKYLVENKIKFKKISSSFLLKDDIKLFLRFNIKVKDIKNNHIILNPISIILWLIQQHFTYKLIIKKFSEKYSNYNPNIKYDKMLRAWFALSENIFKNKLRKSLRNTIIYVTPSIINGTINPRQKRYLEYLKTNNRNYFLYIPHINFYYLLKIAIKIYFSSFHYQLKIPLLEIIKDRMESDNLANFITNNFPNIQEFYTKEEFHPESVYLTEKLKKFNIRVINCAHGLGVYGTIVNYDIFYVFTTIQKSHYERRGNVNFKYYKKIKFKLNENMSKKDLALFFIHQNIFSTRARKSEKIFKIYRDILNYVEKFALNSNIPVYAKYHPGSTKEDQLLSKNIKVVEKVEDLPKNYKYLAITLHSSYILEILDFMPFLIINPEMIIEMRDYFPSNDILYAKTFEDFKEKIEKLSESSTYYYKYWNKLISLING